MQANEPFYLLRGSRAVKPGFLDFPVNEGCVAANFAGTQFCGPISGEHQSPYSSTFSVATSKNLIPAWTAAINGYTHLTSSQ
jgi:hypothetical protein